MDPLERAVAVLGRGVTPSLGSAPSRVERIDGGRGVFSEVHRVSFEPEHDPVVIKYALEGPNGRAAIDSGAYQRERLAYTTILPRTPGVGAARFHGADPRPDGRIHLVMEDLSPLRWVDQMVGLEHGDVTAVTAELATLHETWRDHPDLGDLGVRRSTPSHFSPEALDTGVTMLAGHGLHGASVAELQDLVEHRADLVTAFTRHCDAAPTLCHGDPRADNVAFRDDGRAVLIDWQQLAVQFGEADLAWLLATSVTAPTRRMVEADLVASYALARRQGAEETWQRYRTGMVLPGLASLLLAQRIVDQPRAQQFVSTTLTRVSEAVRDLRVVDLVRT